MSYLSRPDQRQHNYTQCVHREYSGTRGSIPDALFNVFNSCVGPNANPVFLPNTSHSAGPSSKHSGMNYMSEPEMTCAQAYQQVMKRVANTLPAHHPQGSVNYPSFQDNQGTLSNHSYSLCDEQSMFTYPSTSTSSGTEAFNSQINYAQRHDNTILLQQNVFQSKPQMMDSFVAMQAAGTNAAMDASWSYKLEHADLSCGVIPSQQVKHHPRHYRQTSPISTLSRSSSCLESGSDNGDPSLSPPFPGESAVGIAGDGGSQDQQGGASMDAPFMRQLQENNWLSAYGVDAGANNCCKPSGAGQVLDKYSFAQTPLSQMVNGQAGFMNNMKRSSSSCSKLHIVQMDNDNEQNSEFPHCQSACCWKLATKTSPYCSTHSGRRCQNKSGCLKFAVGRTLFCIAHGGGQQCQQEGCVKSTQANTPFCIGHGGGRRCQHGTGCGKSAVGSTRFCKAHGGGRRCQMENCTKSARGSTPYCAGHGGGRRCQHLGCTKSAVGSTPLCVVHGGGRRCEHIGCARSAAGNTHFCITHGGGKPCQFDRCNKSAQAATPFCIAHGGGRRCQFGEGCNKLALSGTTFCKSHGHGPRCRQEGCTKAAILATPFCGIHKNKNLTSLLVPESTIPV